MTTDDSLIVRIASIKAAVSIFQALDAVGHPVHVAGTQQIKCPVHRDRTPSARVYAETNRVYCFRCAAQWDVVGLIAATEKCSTAEACTWLEARFALPAVGEVAPQLVKAVLSASVRPNYDALLAMLSTRAQAARESLGPARFHRFWIALDLASTSYTTGQSTVEQFQRALDQLQTFLRKAEAA